MRSRMSPIVRQQKAGNLGNSLFVLSENLILYPVATGIYSGYTLTRTGLESEFGTHEVLQTEILHIG